jgi:hypothetical protein
MRTYMKLAAASLFGIAACTDKGTGPGSEVRIVAPELQVVEGRELTLSVQAGGQPLSARNVEWSSSDPTTVQVNDGVVRGLAAGVAFVRAGSGFSRDSVEITVRFAESATEGMALRIAGAMGEVVRLSGAGTILQPVGLTNQHLQLRASSSQSESLEDAMHGDSLLFINFPGPIALGTASLNPLVVEWPAFRFTGNSGAFFRIRDSGSRLRFYAPVTPARFEIISYDPPAEPGNVAGSITGSLSFEAAGLVSDVDANGKSFLAPLSDTTVRIYAEFTTAIYHVLTPRIGLSLEGGPDAGTIYAGGAAVVNSGGLSIRLHGFPASSGPEIVRHFEGSIWIPTPSVGTIPVTAADASVLTDSVGAAGAWARFSSMSLTGGVPGTPLHAFSESGTITITAYEAPTRTTFGRIEGEIMATLRYPSGVPVPGTTVLRSRFLMPVNPLDGHPLDRSR